MSSFSGVESFFLIEDLRTYIVEVVWPVMTLISFVEKPAIINTIICSSLLLSTAPY